MPTRADLADGLHHVFYVFAQFHAHWFWRAYRARGMHGIESPPRDAAEMAIHNSTIEAQLLSLRILDEFFSNHKNQDNMLAEEWGMAGDKSFLSRDDKIALNKKLAHLTWHRTGNDDGWRRSLMVKAIRPMREFLDVVEKAGFLASPDWQGVADFFRSGMDRLEAEDRKGDYTGSLNGGASL